MLKTIEIKPLIRDLLSTDKNNIIIRVDSNNEFSRAKY